MTSRTEYSPAVASLLKEGQFSNLGPAQCDQSALSALEKLTVDQIFAGQRIVNRQMADCCLSALWLYYEFLDRSHEISQQISSPEGSYWHAIMHRHEGDYSNAKYWVRRVGDHPVYAELANEARQLAQHEKLDSASLGLASGSWDPYAWVDLCQAAARGQSTLVTVCQQLQQAEWRLLFDFCYQQACQS